MAKHPVRFGLQTGQQNVAWADLVDLWQKADGWGYDSLWVFDHFYPIFSDPKGPCFEGWTALSALAQVTRKARVGHLVSGNSYRHPCLTAKMAATLDHVAGGRFNLGLGAGWFELEHTSFGIDFKTVRGRLDALEEALRIVKGMLAGEAVTLAGAHYQVSDALCRPEPVQSGGVPVMIGGGGRKVLLRLVAQYADIWNYRGNPEEIRELVEVITRHGDAVKRDTDEIEKSVMLPLVYTPDKEKQDVMCQLLGAAFEVDASEARRQIMIGERDECLDKVQAYVDAGCTHFIFMLIPPYDHGEIQAFAEEVAPLARRL